MPIIVESSRVERRPLHRRSTGCRQSQRRRQPRGAQAAAQRVPRRVRHRARARRRPGGRRRPRRHAPGHPAGDQRHPDPPPAWTPACSPRPCAAGMREVVDERDLTGLGARRDPRPAGLGGAQRRRPPPPRAPAARQVTVFSPKGGVGKTTLAVNLGAGADRRRRPDGSAWSTSTWPSATSRSPCSSSRRTPSPTPSPRERARLPRPRAAADQLPRPAHRRWSPRSQPDAKDTIAAALVGRILSLLKAHFDYVVVDTAPAFDEYVLQALDETDELLLVTTLDVPTLKNVKVAVETLDLLNFPQATAATWCSTGPTTRSGSPPDKVESTLGHEHRRRDPDVARRSPTPPTPASRSSAPSPKHAVSQADHPARPAASPARRPRRRSRRCRSAAAARVRPEAFAPPPERQVTHEQSRRPARRGVARPRHPYLARTSDAMATMTERRGRTGEEGRERLPATSSPRSTTPCSSSSGPSCTTPS